MDMLATLLSSRVRAEVFRLLFGLDARELHVRGLARQAGMNEATVRQELRHLAKLDLVAIRKDGNRSYVRANTGHPLYADLRILVLKTTGLVEVLRTALGTQGIQVAFVFGSLAAQTEKAHSDVDLLVIGTVTLRELTGRLAGLTERLGREVNPVVLTSQEFAKRIHLEEHFISRVLEAPKLYVIGDADELERMGGLRMAQSAP